jgi:hypothetical protein
VEVAAADTTRVLPQLVQMVALVAEVESAEQTIISAGVLAYLGKATTVEVETQVRVHVTHKVGVAVVLVVPELTEQLVVVLLVV